MPSPREPEVDAEPYQWTGDGRELDLFGDIGITGHTSPMGVYGRGL